jgi:beta-lactamase class A
MSIALYLTRMLILSLGVGVLAGTILFVWDPAHRAPAGASRSSTLSASMISGSTTQSGAIATTMAATKLGQEMTALKSAVQALVVKSPQFTPEVFLLDLDNNAYLDMNGGAALPAASTIKVPILVAFFQDVDAGKIHLDDRLIMRKELMATGSGEMQYQPVDTQYTALETVKKMITISDNTATNMLIARLGGMFALNQRFKSWGLTATSLNNVLPDLEGTNTSSPKDMALLMARISQGDLVSMRSRDRMLDIMRQTVNNSQLPQGLGEGATISHKTGDIGRLIGDVGLVDLPNGKRYAVTVLVKRSYNDDRAYDLVRQISRMIYQYLSRLPVMPGSSAAEPASPKPDAETSSSPTSPFPSPMNQSGQIDAVQATNQIGR